MGVGDGNVRGENRKNVGNEKGGVDERENVDKYFRRVLYFTKKGLNNIYWISVLKTCDYLGKLCYNKSNVKN